MYIIMYIYIILYTHTFSIVCIFLNGSIVFLTPPQQEYANP